MKYLAHFVTKSNGLEKEANYVPWLTLSQRVMCLKREANYLAYFVTKNNGFEREAKYLAYFVTVSTGFKKGSEVLGLLCHKE